MANKFYFYEILVSVLLVVLASGCIGNSNVPGAHNVINSFVTPFGVLSVSDASGEDLPCIGRYSGMVRGLYEKSSDEDGSYNIHIVYYKSGNSFSDVKNYFISRVEDCGYEKQSETTSGFSFPGAKVVNNYEADYTKDSDDLEMNIIYVKLQTGKEYTFVEIQFNHYSDETQDNSEESSSPSQEDNPYYSSTEVQPNGDLARSLNNVIKPSLISIYGGAKLIKSSTINYNGMEGTDLTYVVKRPVEQSDDSSLADIIRNDGYQIVSDEVSSSDISISSVKNENPGLSVNAILGEYEVEFVDYSIQ